MEATSERLMLSTPSHPRYLSVIRNFFTSLLPEIGFAHDEVMRITLAIHEACTNVIEHAYHGDTSQQIDITVHVLMDRLTVEIRDYGPNADITAIQPRPLEDLRPGGLGTHFIQMIMDDVIYQPASGAGMVVRMSKRRSMP